MALHVICPVSELPVGTMKRVEVGLDDLLLVHLDDGVYAVSDECTHARVSLCGGWLDGDLVCCPKHGGRFHVRTGEAAAFPAVSPLNTYRVSTIDGQIVVDVGE